MKKKNEEKCYSITPKGVIFMAIGGYLEGNMDDTQKVHDKLYEYMERFNQAIIAVDGKLKFVEIETGE